MLELGRHNRISVNERTCPFCTDNCIENEVYVRTNIWLYVDYRCEFYNINSNIEPVFLAFLTDLAKAQMMLAYNHVKIIKEIAESVI